MARSPAWYDHGALRRPLGTDANLVGDGPRLSRLPVEMPAPATARALRSGHLLPRRGGIAARVPSHEGERSGLVQLDLFL